MNKVRTPLFPTYKQAGVLMQAGVGESSKAVRDMITAIHDQTGTPQNPVDWSDPDTWISDRLDGESARLARKIWEIGGGALNPRHAYGSWMFVNNFDLMVIGADGLWSPTEVGRKFMEADETTLRELDEKEGLFDLLELLAGHELAKRGDLLPEWTSFLHQNSKFETESSCKATLRNRLANLIDRGLVDREGNRYQISKAGRLWLTKSMADKPTDPRQDILAGVKRYNQQQKDLLRRLLGKMDPYKFEGLIGELLEAMGYEDVEVTKASGDKGVDVVGRVQVGITTITEVVQVKRIQGSINRTVIDQLRGALPYHKAIRGTIITIGKFASSCEEAALFPGAAPITLIDGDRLIELLIDNGVGVRKSKSIELLDVDNDLFNSTTQAGAGAVPIDEMA